MVKYTTACFPCSMCDVLILGQMFLSHTLPCDFAHYLCCTEFRVDSMHFWYNIFIYNSTASGLKWSEHYISLITQGLYVAQGRWKLLKGGVPLVTVYLCGSLSFKQLRNPLKYRRNLSTSFPVIKKGFVATCHHLQLATTT